MLPCASPFSVLGVKHVRHDFLEWFGMNAVRSFGISVLRAALVAIAYLGALLVMGWAFEVVGIGPLGDGADALSLIRILFSGLLIGLVLGPLASRLGASRRRHILVWSSVVFFNLASVIIEGAFFAPELVSSALPSLLVQQLVASIAVACVIAYLFGEGEPAEARPAPGRRRSWFSWSWRLAASAISYMAFYFVFGAINFALVTRPYYEANAGGLSLPRPEVVLLAESIRAPMIVLSVLPFVLSWKSGAVERMLVTGLVLFAIGGLLPLWMQVGRLPGFLLLASGIEIFLQNFLTGAVTAAILGGGVPDAHAHPPSPIAPVTQSRLPG